MLEPDLQMVYFDQRGSGRSERPWRQAYSVSIMVEDLEQLRLVLGVERLSLIGHSFGGILALEYAAVHPDHVERLVIVDGVSDFPATARAQCERLAAVDTAAYRRALASSPPVAGWPCDPFAAYAGAEREAFNQRSMFPDSAVGARLNAADRRGGLRNTGDVGRALLNPGLLAYRFVGHHRITVPVLVVAGELDFQIGMAPQRELASSLPNGRFVAIPGAGHFPHLDAPERFVELMRTFFER
jgi:proline iminopeptidase